MIVKKSISPKRKSLTPSMCEGRQYQQILRNSNLKTESLDNRNVYQRKDDSKKKWQSNLNSKNNKYIQNHKVSLNGSYNLKNLKTIQISTRKLSLQNKTMISSTTSDNHQIQKYFPHAITNVLQSCERLIKEQKLQEAMKELDEIDNSNIIQEYQQQILYLKGMINMQYQLYDKAINNFQRCIQQGDLNGNAIVLLSIALGKIGNYNEGISILKDFLQKNQGRQLGIYYDALLQKGKLLMKQKKYKLAMNDFMIASSLEKDMNLYKGNLGKGDCLRLCGKYFEALMIYEGLPESQKVQIKKVYCLLELKQFDKGMEIINKILIKDSSCSQALLLKGQIQKKQGQINEAILSFEQSLTQNNSKKAVTQSLLEIAKIKIEQKDFYSAYYTLQRDDHLEVDKTIMIDLKQFTEGVIYLMKRKYKEAIIILSELIKTVQLGEFVKRNIFLYRAYGFICVNKYQKALQDFNYIENVYPLDSPSIYNKVICEGIVMSQQNQFKQAQSLFSKASQLYPGKMEPHLYKALTLIQFINIHQPNDKDKYYKTALKHLDKAVTLNDSNANLLYHRGIIRFYFGQLELALQDLNTAIENTDIRNSKILYARGLVRACLYNPQQALKDFTISIEWDPKFASLYLNRAKVFTQLGDRNQAFNDLQTYISLKPKDSQIYLWAGNLLFFMGAHQSAIKTYSHSTDIQNNIQLLNSRALCYIILQEYNQALIDLNRIYQLTGDERWYIDKECLGALHIAINKITYESEQVSINNFIQITQKQTNFRLASQILKSIIKLDNEGYLFIKSDLIFYRGIMKFYQTNYTKAIDNWNKSFQLKQQRKQFVNLSNQSQSSEQTERTITELDDIEFQDCTYNFYEYYYNIAIATILNNFYSEGNQILDDLANQLPQSFSSKFHYFKDAINAQKIQSVFIFPHNNRLCQVFPQFKVGNAETRLSFGFPKLPSPCMNPEFDQELLQSIQSTDVENKPEAPWIKKNLDGVIFTENIQHFELDFISESQISLFHQNQEDLGEEIDNNSLAQKQSTAYISN